MKASYILVIITLLLLFGISFSTCENNTSTSTETVSPNTHSTLGASESMQNKYIKCESFIEEGTRYIFNKVADKQNTTPKTNLEYDHGEVVINGKILTTTIGAISKDYHIEKAIFEKENEGIVDEYEDGQQDHRAQFLLKSNGKYYYARLELMGDNKFIISKPIESPVELQYFPHKEFGFAINEYEDIETKCTFYYFR